MECLIFIDRTFDPVDELSFFVVRICNFVDDSADERFNSVSGMFVQLESRMLPDVLCCGSWGGGGKGKWS